MSELTLSLACWDYDRTRALMDGSVSPDGIDLIYLPLPVEETFFRMVHFAEFDVSEMSLAGYVASLASPEPPFIAIPVFPSRMFRHSAIYVPPDGNVVEPGDLRGKRVGVPEYHMTAAVWIRGTLADEYDVPVDSVSYFTGGLEQTGRTERIHLDLPPNIHVSPIGPTQTLSQMLMDGELDALYSARAPSAFVRSSGQIRRLFSDFETVERRYFERTRIFPIMHVVVIRRNVYESNPWVARSLVKAFEEAKAWAYRQLSETTALKYTLPWLQADVRSVRELMGSDFWPYGLPQNHAVLTTFLQYVHQQGLTSRLFTPGEIFAPESVESFKI